MVDDVWTELETSFNPLAGIRCFLTEYGCDFLRYRLCFNPLAGIRCFLTGGTEILTHSELMLSFVSIP